MKMQKDYVEWCIMQTNNKKQIHNIAYMFQNIIKKKHISHESATQVDYQK